MLRLWTSADYDYLQRVAKPVLNTITPRPSAQGLDFSPFELPIPPAGHVHLAMGGKPVKVLQEARVLPRNLSLFKLRGRVWPVPEEPDKGCWMVTYDPYMVEREEQALTDIQWDIRLACRLMTTGSLAPEVGQYRWVDDFSKLVDAVKREADETGEKVRLFEDLETLGLWPWYDEAWIVSVAFCHHPGTACVMKFPENGNYPADDVMRQLEWLENAEEVSLGGANLKFDNLWKKVKWGLPWPKAYLFDTLLGGGLVNENRRNSLNIHAKIYTPMGGYDDLFNVSHDKGRMDLALEKDPDGFLLYAGGDVDAGARARPYIVGELAEDAGLVDFYTTVLHPAARAFEKIEHTGILVDAEQLKTVGITCDEEIEAAHADMYELVPTRIKRKRSGETADKLKFTPAVLRDIFFDEAGWDLTPLVKTEKAPEDGLVTNPTKYASTSVDSHLKRFSDHPQAGPFLVALKRKNKAEKIRSSYVDGFLKHLRPDGRFHPTFALHVGSQYEEEDDGSGTNTGRTAAKNPHAQTIPKRAKPDDYNWPRALRLCYPAPPGKLVGEIDFSQGELKIHAMLAQEPTMIQLFLDDKDMHLMTGCRSQGISYEEGLGLELSDPKLYKRIRYGAKAQNFGLIYLQSPPGFQRYAYKEWDLDYTLEECEEIHSEFFKLYRLLRAYANHQMQGAIQEGCVRNPFGRVRHLPLARSKDRKTKAAALRQAVNAPTQSTLSDMGLWAIAIADGPEHDLLDRGLEVFNFVHDAVQFYFPDSSAGFDLVLEMKEIMENLPYHELGDWEPELKMTTDFEFGPNLATMRGVKGWAKEAAEGPFEYPGHWPIPQ